MILNNTLTARSPRSRGFTLIELLTVVAVIGILASILIPVVGGARKSAVRAKSKAQFQGWATALVAYQSEYGYFPDIGNLASAGSSINLASGDNSKDLVMALSGRAVAGGTLPSGSAHLNPRQTPFYSFAESEFFYNTRTGLIEEGDLVDGFNNRNIFVAVDHDGNGMIPITSVSSNLPSNSGLPTAGNYRGRVLIWTKKDAAEGYEDVMSWN